MTGRSPPQPDLDLLAALLLLHAYKHAPGQPGGVVMAFLDDACAKKISDFSVSRLPIVGRDRDGSPAVYRLYLGILCCLNLNLFAI